MADLVRYIVRYGANTCTPDKLAETAEAHYRDLAEEGREEYGISVHVGEPGCSPEETAAFGEEPHGQFRWARMRDLRDSGFDFACEIDLYGHTLIYLPNPWTMDDCVRMSDCFIGLGGLGKNPNPTRPHERTSHKRKT